MKLVRVNNRWPIWLPDHRADRPEWPTWEAKRLQSMFETTKPGDVVYYIGAEEGDMAGLLTMWGAKVVLFEPNDKVWPNIRAIWRFNKLPDPPCFYGFASDITSENNGSFAGWPPAANGPLIHDHGFKELVDPDEVPQVRIDDYVSHQSPPQMISIDTEGSEGKVLRGAEQTLRQFHPRIYLSLHPEMMMNLYGEYSAELRKWVKDLGYEETLLDNPLHEYHYLYEVAE